MRTLAELAQLAAEFSISIEDLRRAVEGDPERSARTFELSAQEVQRLQGLRSLDQALRLYKQSPDGVMRVLGYSAADLEELRAIPPDLIPPKSPLTAPPGSKNRVGRGRHGQQTRDVLKDDKAPVEAKMQRLQDAIAVHDAENSVAAELAQDKEHPGFRSRVKKPHRATRIRASVVRRIATHKHPQSGILDWGTSPQDVAKWIRAGLESKNPREKWICQRLARRKFRLQAIAFALFHLQCATEAAGFDGVVANYSRQMLADLLCIASPGSRGGVGLEALNKRTISRYLRELKAACGSVFNYWQPSQEATRTRKLPGARHVMSDGSTEYQGYNLYWFREIAENAPPDRFSPPLDHPLIRDPSTDQSQYKISNLAADPKSGAVSPKTATEGSGGRGPPQGGLSGDSDPRQGPTSDKGEGLMGSG